MKASVPEFRKFANSDDYFLDIDGKRIARKSIWTARVYSEPYKLESPFVEYPSRIEHCYSCLSDAEEGYGIDECCCIHAQFHSKKEENNYVKSTGFWRVKWNS